MKLYEIKSDHVKTIRSPGMKISAITSNKPSSYYEQPPADLAKQTLLKSPVKFSHASQLTKHFSSKNL